MTVLTLPLMRFCSKITFDISGESGETASLLVTDGNNQIVYVMSEKLKETGAVFNVVMPDYNNASSDISGTYFYILKKGESKINGEFDYIGSFKRKEYIKILTNKRICRNILPIQKRIRCFPPSV